MHASDACVHPIIGSDQLYGPISVHSRAAGAQVHAALIWHSEMKPTQLSKHFALQVARAGMPSTLLQQSRLRVFTLSECQLHCDQLLLCVPGVRDAGVEQGVLLHSAAGARCSARVLHVWSKGRCCTELQVPAALHGPLVNDGYFASGAAWSEDEQAVAYTAEVSLVCVCL
eukprot:1157308-Pelagomonas_calceolata.AAC.2